MLTISSSSGVQLPGTYFILSPYSGDVVMAGFYDRAKSRVRSLACSFGNGVIRVGYQRYNTIGSDFWSCYKPVRMGHDKFVYCETINKALKGRWVLTNEENKLEDCYQFLMNNFKMPLLREWVPYILNKGAEYHEEYGRMVQEPHLRIFKSYDNVKVPLHENMVSLEDLILIDFSTMNEKGLQDIVSCGLKNGEITINGVKNQEPLSFDGFNDYVSKYGSSIVENLERDMEPLSPLKGKVEAAAFYKKRMYPQQGACVNGVIALVKAKAKYAFVAEGMGCGKTLQGAAIADTTFNEMWLEKNPSKTLKDLYANDEVGYRNIVMAPSHLIEKWKEEIESEIPHSKATIIRDFGQLIEIRNRGITRSGREWFLISKDFCKLGSQYSPIPTQIGRKYPVLKYCAECYNDTGALSAMVTDKGGRCSCPSCGGTKVMLKDQTYYGKQRGMLCPECGNLLLKASPKWYDGRLENPLDYVLGVKDFAGRNQSNAKCVTCGAILWGADCKPVDYTGQNFENVPYKIKSAWRKISHFKNCTKKSRTTAFVLKNHEEEYKTSTYTSDWKELGREYGPRKHAPALFIKKYLKGYFDFCVLDECHKYENGGTAQTTAAQALVKASNFTLALTGTLTNGKADSLFYLLYMLDPAKMQKAGYGYADVMEFAKKYGSVETVYEVDSSKGAYNKNSRGRQLQSPTIKPGISPLLVTDFLLERAVFLDLSDLSKYLPKLKEEVILVKQDDEILRAYKSTIDELKDDARNGGGLGSIGKSLIFGLSYLDKPFGRSNIMSPKVADDVIAHVQNFDEYENKLLPKEEKLVELINKEIQEDRNCFVYASYTGEAELNVTGRLKNVIEQNCNLKGQVLILESSSPKAEEREAYIKKKATEGYRVIICNPKCVETGLDFCFWEDGKWYNYPTLIFYQISYELSVMWQASRRAYRLVQTEECRNYYLGYEDTLQAAALEIMAEKQVAASAIQGKFSAEGLSALAKGVDPRLKLAQMLSDGDMSDRASLKNMFDALNKDADNSDDSRWGEYEEPMTYYELMGIGQDSAEDIFSKVKEDVIVTPVAKRSPKEEKTTFICGSLFDLMEGIPTTTFTFNDDLVSENTIKSKKKEKKLEGQVSLFDLLAC